MLQRLQSFGTIILFSCIAYACQQDAPTPIEKQNFKVAIAISSEPDALNPVTSITTNALSITNLIFQKLLDVDFETLQSVPVLAAELPTIEQINDSTFLVHYQIRPEARWDNGLPITANDVIFTFKLACLPQISNAAHLPYLSFIRDIKPDANDPLRLTFVCKPNLRLLYSTGSEVAIMPQYLYDSEDLLSRFSFAEIVKNYTQLDADSIVIRFAESFNSLPFQRDTAIVNGSGAYKLISWETNQKVVLQKKIDWWGDALLGTNLYFENEPSEINFYVLTETAPMIAAARNGQLDIGPIVKSADFVSLQADSSFLKSFVLINSPELSTNVIIVNSCKKALSTVKTRQALAHLFDTEGYIKTVQKLTSKRVIGPLHPSKAEYNHQLTPYDYNVQKAKQLLAEDGWSDSNNDGILDKQIGGKKVKLELEYKYNTGNEGRKNAGLLFKEWAAPAGVSIKLSNEEWLVYIQSLMERKFDLAFFSWTDEHAPTDPAPVYHTAAISNGYNFGCFGNAQSDSLINSISVVVDENTRKHLWWELQEIMHREVACIFLSTNETRLFVSKKFELPVSGAVNPGFWAGSLKPIQP
jgi:peptide/nickel transport system substrate-binding protein